MRHGVAKVTSVTVFEAFDFDRNTWRALLRRAKEEEIEGRSSLTLTKMKSCSLLALGSCGFKLVALLPFNQLGRACRRPPERESESGHRRVSNEIHLGMILVAGLMVVLLGVLVQLLQTPCI